LSTLSLKKRIRKKLGFYYRQLRQYYKNKAVYQQIIDLSNQPLNYYSVLQQQTIAESDVLTAVQSGDVIVVKDLIGQLKLQTRFDALIKDYFGVDYADLGDIHQTKTIEQIVDDALAVRHSIPTLILQTSIMKRLLTPHVSQAYLELQPNLRLHLPYAKVKAHESYIESRMGRGKLNPHGQHKDSWRYHPKNTLNVWVALTQVNDKNGMGVLPQSGGYQPKFDGALQEIASGVKTYPSQQYVTDMQAGDALIFEAELMHGSIINMTRQTRGALSMRCTTTEPQFHRRVTYNYIKVARDNPNKGGFDNLTKIKLAATGDFEPASTDTTFAPAEQKNTSIKPLHYDDEQITIEVDGQPRKFPRKCPHAGTDMLNGELNEQGQLLCPSHRMCLSGKPCQS
jgi:ectoine hydroxylase-related dioxygenase (phytanoyl-CoA dioxygenase family)